MFLLQFVSSQVLDKLRPFTDLIVFTEEIRDEKIHFLCSVSNLVVFRYLIHYLTNILTLVRKPPNLDFDIRFFVGFLSIVYFAFI